MAGRWTVLADDFDAGVDDDDEIIDEVRCLCALPSLSRMASFALTWCVRWL